MKPEFGLISGYFNTSFAPLCVLGHLFWERNEVDGLRKFDAIGMKTHYHKPGEKLLDAFLLLLAGYPSLYLLNSKLRPDPILAQAWHRDQLAEQSTVSRTLDAATASHYCHYEPLVRTFGKLTLNYLVMTGVNV